MSQECIADGRVVSIPTLRAGEPEDAGLLRAAAGTWIRGAAMDWPAVFADSGAALVDLPTYAFQHRRYWRTGAHYWCDSEHRVVSMPDDLGRAEPADSATGPDPAVEFRAGWSELDPARRLDYVLGVVRAQLSAILIDCPVDDIDTETGILGSGLTSLSVLELRARLNTVAGTALPLENFFADPTPRALAELICAGLTVPELASSRTTP
ncbi:phosphopantetheine-binding protein [Nocardia iowensis]